VKQKLYCYVDESGQDTKSSHFVVVAIVNNKDQVKIRKDLINLESKTKIGIRKWHKSSTPRKHQFLTKQIISKLLISDIFYGVYKKPLPYFLPIIDTLEKSIKTKSNNDYSCTVYIDGIDKKKAKELTNALRFKGIRLSLVKSRRDESEPIIRLADRWAGCIRGSQLGNLKDKNLIRKALKSQILTNISKNFPG